VWFSDLTMWRDVVAKSPDKPRAWTNLGLAYQNREPHRVVVQTPRGNQVIWGQARELPGDLLIVQPTGQTTLGPPTVIPKGDARIEQFPGSDEEARAAYERALELDPEYYKALNNLGLISAYQHHNRIKEVMDLELRLIPFCKQQGGDLRLVEALEARAAEARQEQDALFATAERCLQETFRLQKSFVICNNIGNLYSDRRMFDKAIEWLDRALGLEGCPEDVWAISGDTRFQQGMEAWAEGRLAESKGRWKDALRRYDEYLGRAPRGQFRKHVGERKLLAEGYLDGSQVPGQPNPAPGR